MGRDCKYCGAYISDMVDVCPACGKRSKPEKKTEAEHWTGSYTSGAAAQAAPPEHEKRSESSERSQAYTYKQEYERRYGSQTGSSARRPGQQAPPRGASRQQSYEYQSPQAAASYNSGGKSRRSEDDDIESNKGISYLSYFGPLFLIPYFARNDSEFARFHSNQGLLLLLANIAVNSCSALPIIGWIIRIIGTVFVLSGFISGLSNVSKGLKKPLPVIGSITILK